ncbi:MAG: AraC family transcriptional regulator [Gammaproteobacteria bacterium]|nr:AraC family transcriptional regulator [Gammaproteobacteria bacterium]
MSQSSTIEYQKRIDRALSYIRDNLDKPISLSEVAKAVCFSEFHFHRLFSAIMHETVGEYITRKKLEQAAVKLAYGSSSTVSGLADEYGYASVSSFSKAFKQWFGCRPSEIHKIKQRLDSGDGKLQSKYEKSLDARQLFAEEDSSESRFLSLDKKIELKSIEAFDAVYLTSPGGYEVQSIRDTWIKINKIFDEAGVDWNQCERYSLSHEHPGLAPPERCRYDALVCLPSTAQAQTSLPRTTIPSGLYAVYPVEGPEESLLSQYLDFYTHWMPRSGYEPDNYPVLERLLPGCEVGHIYVELWAKVNPLADKF